MEPMIINIALSLIAWLIMYLSEREYESELMAIWNGFKLGLAVLLMTIAMDMIILGR